MTDKELLELAAKAAGIECEWSNDGDGMWLMGERSPDNSRYWNPLTDDGDALRLAVKLGIDIGKWPGNTRWAFFHAGGKLFTESCEKSGIQDPYAATRRAIVRAAADIGKDL
jgi:hypothetical protein